MGWRLDSRAARVHPVGDAVRLRTIHLTIFHISFAPSGACSRPYLASRIDRRHGCFRAIALHRAHPRASHDEAVACPTDLLWPCGPPTARGAHASCRPAMQHAGRPGATRSPRSRQPPAAAARMVPALQGPDQMLSHHRRTTNSNLPPGSRLRCATVECVPRCPAVRIDEARDHLRDTARHPCLQRARSRHFANLSPASQALILSQPGPPASRCNCVMLTHADVTITRTSAECCLWAAFACYSRRSRTCSCRGHLEALGDG